MGSGPSKNLKKVNIEINFWYGRNGDVGHVSLYIVDSFLYISFWPEGTAKLNTKVPSASNTYEEDKSEEERDADYVLKTNIDLDTSAIEEFWRKAKNQNYSFLRNNCSDAVMKALEAGNDDFLFLSQPFPPSREPNANWTRKDYIVWVREKLREFRIQGIHHALQRNL